MIAGQLAHLESFIASAEEHSFSAAARRLGLTPAAVSKNVARLESALGVRLFQRSTRSLNLTEEGERLFRQAQSPWTALAQALDEVQQGAGKPAGALKVGMALAVGRNYFVPMLEEFLRLYPDIVPDLHFENRQVDLIAERYDVAIGGSIDLAAGMIARELARVKVVVVAAPAYLAAHPAPQHPQELVRYEGVVRRSSSTGRLNAWTLRNDRGEVGSADIRPLAVFDDPEAMARAAASGLGIALLPAPHALPFLRSGELVRILPEWYADIGALSIYYSSRKFLPAKTRVFVDFVVDKFREQGYAEQFAAL
jgi:DNA-binding transcriptional LysR family regulator